MSRLAAGFVLATLVVPAAAGQAAQPADECLMLSYFVGNGEDGLHLAHSRDGLRWKALAGGRSLLRPTVGRDRLMRDPSIARGPDGTFHMVWTTSWNERIIGYARSEDLVHWSPQRAIPVMMHEPTARNSWAPELFYDQPSGQFLIIWSTTIPGRFPQTGGSSESDYNHRVYCTQTADFEAFTPTRLLFDPGYNVIDGFLAAAGEEYLLFFKDETLKPQPRKVILMATAEKLLGPYTRPTEPISPRDWIEGPSAIRIGDRWFVYFDCYRRHRYGAATSTDLERWTDVTDKLVVPAGTRHGTVFRVDRETRERLLAVGG
ncbi:MAG: glycoside hydrolase family 43 protein [Pirellulales bacterium]|nr:glycoside hydrolase family 43 protein [Pirellulales bacterium]